MGDLKALCQVCGKATDVLHKGVCFDCAAAPQNTVPISAQWKDASPVPTESNEQQALFDWAARLEYKWPELALLFHIPNEGKRSKITGARMKREGLRSGVPDICLPVARNGSHGLYIELKRRKDSRVTKDQLDWIEALVAEGYMAAVCRGCDEAIALIEGYLEGRL